jgi:hypothetical protein
LPIKLKLGAPLPPRGGGFRWRLNAGACDDDVDDEEDAVAVVVIIDDGDDDDVIDDADEEAEGKAGRFLVGS